jgi:hypothetical protein
VAKRTNYGFQKRQKEIKRQQKKDAKAEKKRLKKEEQQDGDEGLALNPDQDSESLELPSDPDPERVGGG